MKKSRKQFFTWMRNGTAFCTTWFLIIWLICCHILNYPSISVHSLTKMLLLVLGGVFIFSVLFTQIIIQKWTFTTRLTWFILFISLYESLGFYWIGLFHGKGTLTQWGIFIGIVFFLYLCCIAIYQQYSKKQGELYTQALETYQKKRSEHNGE